MTKNLFITKILNNQFQKKNKLFLGRSCISNITNHSEIGDFECIDYHWNDNSKFNQDYKYLYDLYYKIIEAISRDLNQFHKLNKSKTFWFSIVGSWIYKFLISSFDKWETTKLAFNNYDISNVYNYDQTTSNLIPSDITDFNHLIESEVWNNCLTTEIIKFKKIKNINFINMKCEKNLNKNFKLNKHQAQATTLLKYIDRLFSFLQRKPNVVLFKTYFGKIRNLKLFLKFESIPRIFTEFDESNDLPFPTERRGMNLNMKTFNEFENFLTSKIFEFIPVSYLEGFNEINKIQKKINIHPSLIISAMGETNDLFTIWAANQREKKTVYFYSEHGGILEDLGQFNSRTIKYDCFLSWNHSIKKNSFQISPHIYSKKININLIKNSKKLYVILTSSNKHTFFINSGLKTVQSLESYEKLKFLRKLPAKIKKNIKFRPHPTANFWSIEERIRNDFGSEYICNEKKIENAFSQSKIILDTDFQTTFYEGMSTGRPVLVFSYNKLMDPINPEIKNLLNNFIEEKIIFNNTEKLSQHIENIWENPQEWWSSKNILNLRNEFKNLCQKSDNREFDNSILNLHKRYEKKF